MKKIVLYIVFAFLSIPNQAQESADSSWHIWENESENDTIRLAALRSYFYDKVYEDPEGAFEIAKLCLEFSTIIGDRIYQAESYLMLGDAFDQKGDDYNSIKNYSQALKIFQNIGDRRGISKAQWTLGVRYYQLSQYIKAINYYSESLIIRRELKDTNAISGLLTNLGSIYKARGDYDKALKYYNQANDIFKKAGVLNAVALEGIVDIYIFQRKYDEAINFLSHLELQDYSNFKYFDAETFLAAIAIRYGDIYSNQGLNNEALSKYFEVLKLLNTNSKLVNLYKNRLNQKIGQLYIKLRQGEKAIQWCNEASILYNQNNSIIGQRDVCLCLYEAHKLLGNNSEALRFLEQFNILNDSLNFEETASRLQKMESANQIREDSIKQADEFFKLKLSHQNEVLKKDKTRNSLVSMGGLLLLFSVFLFSRYRIVNKAKVEIQLEKKRSDDLLLNILPLDIAEELKDTGVSKPRHIQQTSILFTDFIRFTEVSSQITSEELVSEINKYFKKFDAICKKYNVEKIKTIGDSYMAVSSLGESTNANTNTLNLVFAGLEMNKYVYERLLQKKENSGVAFEMRTGIHTGSVAAGIVGESKFQYDVWGDAVNTASRMESNGESGKVNISRATYELIKDNPKLKFFDRGKFHVKGKGEIEMYFVEESNKSY